VIRSCLANKSDPIFTVLDAPLLRDDYYTTLLAYSSTLDILAVGLGRNVYLWSEAQGVSSPESINMDSPAHITSLSFSSAAGAQAILAIARAEGSVTLWSPLDTDPRFDIRHQSPASCVCFSPTTRKGQSYRDHDLTICVEDLLVGDETGVVYYWTIEWPSALQRDLFGFSGATTLIARLSCHTQQICGLSWSPNAEYFASGSNDNICVLFETRSIVSHPSHPGPVGKFDLASSTEKETVIPEATLDLQVANAKQTWALNAAVKAIAFSPHHRRLLALGGGSNDRQIHFVHILSGAVLARIDCCAQVTSLIWSKARREICATFGFAQPDHSVRVAVFAWPTCEQLVAIPWLDEHRALWAIPYPGGPAPPAALQKPVPSTQQEGSEDFNDSIMEGESRYCSRTKVEGCVIIATSDASIKFHEVWPEKKRRAVTNDVGHLGGSAILEERFGQTGIIR